MPISTLILNINIYNCLVHFERRAQVHQVKAAFNVYKKTIDLFHSDFQTERIEASPVDVKHSGAFGTYQCIIGETFNSYDSRMPQNPG